MNKKIILTLTAMFGLCSTNFIFTNAASAQMSADTQQLINDTNAVVDFANQFLESAEQQKQQEMNALSSACNSGDSQACLDFQIRLNAENRAIDNAIQTSRNRQLCGSPVCP